MIVLLVVSMLLLCFDVPGICYFIINITSSKLIEITGNMKD